MSLEKLLLGMLLGWILWNALYIGCSILYFALDQRLDKRRYKKWKESHSNEERKKNYSQIFHTPLEQEKGDSNANKP